MIQRSPQALTSQTCSCNKLFAMVRKKIIKFNVCLGEEPQKLHFLETSIEIFVNCPLKKRQFWDEKCHSKIKIKMTLNEMSKQNESTFLKYLLFSTVFN